MKEIKRTRTIEETVGYEANDGTMFKTEEECKKYEETARAVIRSNFKRLIVGEEFYECRIWENFGYGSEEYKLAVIEVKNEEDFKTVQMLCESEKCGQVEAKDCIGKRVLINLGYECDFDSYLNPRTEEELIEEFKANIKKFFHPEDVNRKENE